MGLFDTPLFKNVAAACKNAALSRFPSPAANALRAPRADPQQNSAAAGPPEKSAPSEQQRPEQQRPEHPSPPGSPTCELPHARMQPVHLTAPTPLRHTPRSSALLEAAARADDACASDGANSSPMPQAPARTHAPSPASAAPARTALNRAKARTVSFAEPGVRCEIAPADSDAGEGDGMEEDQDPTQRKMRAMERELAQARAETQRERAVAERAKADVAQTVEQNTRLRQLAEQEERRVHLTEGLRSDLHNTGKSVLTQQRNLAATADRIGWHCNLDGTPGLGSPGDNEMKVSSEHGLPSTQDASESARPVPGATLPAYTASPGFVTPGPSGPPATPRALNAEQEQQYERMLRCIHTYTPHPSHAKVSIAPVRKWTARDNAWRDATVFLKECCAYAAAARQEIVAVVTANMSEEMQTGYCALLDTVVRTEPTQWHACVKAFLLLTGRDLSDPQAEAYRQLDRGRIHQNKGESVLDYGNRVRILHMRSGAQLPVTSVCDRFIDGLWSHNLRRDIALPFWGGQWTDLNQCIQHAVARAHVLEKTSAPRMSHVSAVSKFGGNTFGPKRPRLQNEKFITNKRPRSTTASPPRPPPPPPRPRGPPGRGPASEQPPDCPPHLRHIVPTKPPPKAEFLVPFNDMCYECNRWGHKAQSHTAPWNRNKGKGASAASVDEQKMQE